MSQENVEVVRRAHKAFSHPGPNGFDLDVLYVHTDPDVVVDWSRSDGLEAGIYRGEAQTRRLWATFFEAFDQVVVEPLEFIEHGEHVVVPHHLRPPVATGSRSMRARWWCPPCAMAASLKCVCTRRAARRSTRWG